MAEPEVSLADQLNLFQPGGGISCYHIYSATPKFLTFRRAHAMPAK